MLRGKRRAALFIARGYIESVQEKYICYALDRAARQYPELREAVVSITYDILSALGGPLTLEGWQLKNMGFAIHQNRLNRLAWIDWMLENWK